MSQRDDVLSILKSGGATVSSMVLTTGWPRPSTRRVLNKMVKDGDLVKVEEVYLSRGEEENYYGRVTPCPRCGKQGAHQCCSKCVNTATGFEAVKAVFGLRKNRLGELSNQPQCKVCRTAAVRRSRGVWEVSPDEARGEV